MTDNEKLMLARFGKYIHENDFSNDFLVQIIELSGAYLGLKTITDYAKENNISYNGAKKFRNVINILGNKFIIDNE